MTGVVGVAAWLLLVALQLLPLPAGDWRSWVVQVFNVLIGAVTAFSAATLAHTRDLKARS